MLTTIAVKKSTAQLLTHIKEKMDLNSLDDTIIKIVEKVKGLPASRFGSQPKLKKFEESERAYSHEL